MKETKVACPKCGKDTTFKNYWIWILKTPFHWLWWDKSSKRICDYRYTKCSHCGIKSWIKKVIK